MIYVKPYSNHHKTDFEGNPLSQTKKWLKEEFGVTHIRKGTKGRPESCPLARTLAPKLINKGTPPFTSLSVSNNFITVRSREPDGLIVKRIELPQFVREFIYGFDAGGYPELVRKRP